MTISESIKSITYLSKKLQNPGIKNHSRITPMYLTRIYVFQCQVQDFRRNCLSMCESAVNERNATDRSAVLYNYPPNLLATGDDEIDGIELIEVDVCYSTSDGKLTKVPIKVCVCVCVITNICIHLFLCICVYVTRYVNVSKRKKSKPHFAC